MNPAPWLRFLLVAATLQEYTVTPQELPKEQERTEHKAAKKKERFDRSHSAPNLTSMPPLRDEAQVDSLKNFDWRGEKGRCALI
jgi:hypothetical protein